MWDTFPFLYFCRFRSVACQRMDLAAHKPTRIPGMTKSQCQCEPVIWLMISAEAKVAKTSKPRPAEVLELPIQKTFLLTKAGMVRCRDRRLAIILCRLASGPLARCRGEVTGLSGKACGARCDGDGFRG